jgi:hypothetical protein
LDGDALNLGDLLVDVNALAPEAFIAVREVGGSTAVSVDRNGGQGALGLNDAVASNGVAISSGDSLPANSETSPLSPADLFHAPVDVLPAVAGGVGISVTASADHTGIATPYHDAAGDHLIDLLLQSNVQHA